MLPALVATWSVPRRWRAAILWWCVGWSPWCLADLGNALTWPYVEVNGVNLSGPLRVRGGCVGFKSPERQGDGQSADQS